MLLKKDVYYAKIINIEDEIKNDMPNITNLAATVVFTTVKNKYLMFAI